MSTEIVYSKKLSPQQAAEFATLERTAIEGRQVFYVVGAALGTIKEKRYFLNKGFETFALYAESIGFSKRHCDQLILDSEAVKSLPAELRKLITSGNAAKALAQVPQSLRAGVVKAALESSKAVTAQTIKKATPSSVPQRKVSKIPHRTQAATKIVEEKGPLDETGIEIPKECLELWLSANKEGNAKELCMYAESVALQLKKRQESKDLLFVEIDFTDNIAKLKSVIENLKLAVPWAVCPTCQGKLAAGCLTCSGRGFVSRFYWTTCVPEETRLLRPKGWK